MDNSFLNNVSRVLETYCSCKSRKTGKAYFTPQTEILKMAVTVVNVTINNLSVMLL